MPKNQMEIPGTERPKIKEIEVAAEDYVAIRDKRMALTEKECAAKLTLIETVKAHASELTKDLKGNRVYRYDDQLVMLIPGSDNVKVKVDHGEDGDDEGED